MKKWIIIGVILLIVIIISVYLYKKSKDTSSSTIIVGSAQRKSGLVSQCEAMGGTWGNLGDVWGTVNGVAGWYPNYGCIASAATK